MNAMEVVGVRIEMPSNQPIILLKEVSGVRFLPIWVGAVEATAIAFAQQGVQPPRPLTHDLVKIILDTVGATLEQVVITKVQDGIFFAELVLALENRAELRISARPSDAIAIALRTQSKGRFRQGMLVQRRKIPMRKLNALESFWIK